MHIYHILLYIYLLFLCFQLGHHQRINCHHRRHQFILADIKRRATMFFNGQVLTLYTTFWLIAVTYRILQHLLHQLRHYAPQSTTIIIIITVITIIPLTILAITAIMIIITIVGHQVIFILIILTCHIIINSIILLRCIIITITQILWQLLYHPPSLYNLSCCNLQAQINQPVLATRRKNNIVS